MAWAKVDAEYIYRFAELGKPEIIIFLVLLLYRNDKTGQCNPSRRTIGEVARMKSSQVSRAIGGLIAKGWIFEDAAGFEVVAAENIPSYTAECRETNKGGVPAWVYLMRDRATGYIKIGASINPKHREQTLRKGTPEIELSDAWAASYQHEVFLHKRYAAARIRGEWFALTPKHVAEIGKHFRNHRRFVNLQINETATPGPPDRVALVAVPSIQINETAMKINETAIPLNIDSEQSFKQRSKQRAPSPKKKRTKKEPKERTRIPEPFPLTPEMIANYRENYSELRKDVVAIHRKFINHWTDATGKQALKSDWPATWRNWLDNEVYYQRTDDLARGIIPDPKGRPGSAGTYVGERTDADKAAAQEYRDRMAALPDCAVCDNERQLFMAVDPDAEFSWNREKWFSCPGCQIGEYNQEFAEYLEDLKRFGQAA